VPRVPQDISVIGFDDGLEASLTRLTSYSFNGAAVMHAMLDHVLSGGRSPLLRGVRHPIEVPGAIVVRQTTGLARKATA